MALQSVTDENARFLAEQEQEEQANARWRPSSKSEEPRDIFDKKLYQAEMLAYSLLGDGFEAFSNHHDRIQEGVLWALADLITEAREALEAVEK